jgi:hypothetical protein
MLATVTFDRKTQSSHLLLLCRDNDPIAKILHLAVTFASCIYAGTPYRCPYRSELILARVLEWLHRRNGLSSALALLEAPP